MAGVEGAEYGILFKGADAMALPLDTSGDIDKTGTLTKGEPSVTEVLICGRIVSRCSIANGGSG